MFNTEIKLIIFFAAKDGEALYSQQKQNRSGADCGSDHRLHIAKFRLKLKKVGKTTRPARYDLNLIPHEYSVEVMNGFKWLEHVNSVPEEQWTEIRNTVEEAASKIIPKQKKSSKAKWLSEEAFKYLWKEEKQNTKEKTKDILIWMQSFKE